MKKKDQILLEEAYQKVQVSEAGIFNKIKTVAKGFTSGTKDTMTPEDFKTALIQAGKKAGIEITYEQNPEFKNTININYGNYPLATLKRPKADPSTYRIFGLGNEWYHEFQKQTGLDSWPYNGDTIKKIIKVGQEQQNKPASATASTGDGSRALRGNALYSRFGSPDPGASYPGVPSRRI